MSYFLWVEDFESNVQTTVTNVLGDLKLNINFKDKIELKNKLDEINNSGQSNQGVFLELTFFDGLKFLNEYKSDIDKKIDYVILDIDLQIADDILNIVEEANNNKENSSNLIKLLKDYENFDDENFRSDSDKTLKEKLNEVKKIAGFHLYTKLIFELGFPKYHIIFCTNHGDEIDSIKTAFKNGRIPIPTFYTKSEDESGAKKLINELHKNSYSRLRRGIIEGCRYLKELNTDKYRFGEFMPKNKPSHEYLKDYLDDLSNALPLREPKEAKAKSHYKSYVRTLAHEWEAAKPKNLQNEPGSFAFSWIMEMTRNWSAHGKVFESLQPEDVAYLFMINMRAMFKLDNQILPYEKHLLGLFNNKSAIEKHNKNLPLASQYISLLKKSRKIRGLKGNRDYRVISFHDILNEIQKSNQFENDLLITGLYQSFWFLNSYGYISVPENEEENLKKYTQINYKFNYFDYTKEGYFISELASHIYKRSFP